jgi:hypothetical protein
MSNAIAHGACADDSDILDGHACIEDWLKLSYRKQISLAILQKNWQRDFYQRGDKVSTPKILF